MGVKNFTGGSRGSMDPYIATEKAIFFLGKELTTIFSKEFIAPNKGNQMLALENFLRALK